MLTNPNRANDHIINVQLRFYLKLKNILLELHWKTNTSAAFAHLDIFLDRQLEPIVLTGNWRAGVGNDWCRWLHLYHRRVLTWKTMDLESGATVQLKCYDDLWCIMSSSSHLRYHLSINLMLCKPFAFLVDQVRQKRHIFRNQEHSIIKERSFL